MEGAAPENASRNRNRRRGGRRRKYPALKDQKICLLELIPPGADRVIGPSRAQTVPSPNRAQITGPSHPHTVHRSNRAQAPGPSHPQTVHGPSSASSSPGLSHAQTSSNEPTGSVIGQEVEGIIDGTFQDGFLISMKIGEMTLKGVAYGLGTNEPDLALEGQTVRFSQLEAESVRTVQSRSRIGNSGGGSGTSSNSNPTKHQDKDQARDVRGRGKGVKIEQDLN